MVCELGKDSTEDNRDLKVEGIVGTALELIKADIEETAKSMLICYWKRGNGQTIGRNGLFIRY